MPYGDTQEMASIILEVKSNPEKLLKLSKGIYQKHKQFNNNDALEKMLSKFGCCASIIIRPRGDGKSWAEVTMLDKASFNAALAGPISYTAASGEHRDLVVAPFDKHKAADSRGAMSAQHLLRSA